MSAIPKVPIVPMVSVVFFVLKVSDLLLHMVPDAYGA